MSSDVHSLVHKWTIDNFGHFYKEEWNFDKIESDKFYSKANKEEYPTLFHLRLHPNGERERYRNSVTLYLYCLSVQEKINVWFQISIIDANGDRRNTRALRHMFDERHGHFGFGHYIRVQDLLDQSSGLVCDDKLTLLCELHVNVHGKIQDNSIVSEVSESHSNTQPQVAFSLAHKWTIDNYASFYHAPWPIITNRVESQKFNSPFDTKNQFYLRLYPNGMEDKHKGHMTVSLVHFSVDKLLEVNVMWRVSILDVKGEKWHTRSTQNKFTPNLNNYNILKFLPVLKLLEHSNILLRDDKLDIFCEIKILATEVNHLATGATQMEWLYLANPQYNPSHDSVRLRKCAHKWTIHNFSSALSNESSSSEVKLVSSAFTASQYKAYNFTLSAFPSGHDDEGRSCVSFVITHSFQFSMRLIYQLRLSLIGEDGSNLLLDDSIYSSAFHAMGMGSNIIGKAISYDELCKQKMLKDDDGSITLYCEIDIIQIFDQTVLSSLQLQAYFRKLSQLKLNENQVSESVTNATGKKVKLEYTWEVENFAEMCGRGNDTSSFVSHSNDRNFSIQSSTFSQTDPPSLDHHRFELSLFLNYEEEGQKYLSPGLNVSLSRECQLLCEYSISLLDSVGFKYNTHKGEHRFNRKKSRSCGYTRYISHEDFFNPVNDLLKDNKLRIHCEIEFVDEEEIDDEKQNKQNKPNEIANFTTQNNESIVTPTQSKEEINDEKQNKQNKTSEIANFTTPNNETVVTPTQSITQVTFHIHHWTIDNFGLYFQSNRNELSSLLTKSVLKNSLPSDYPVTLYLEYSKFSPVNNDQLQFVLGYRPMFGKESESFEIYVHLISEKITQTPTGFLIILILNENGAICFRNGVYLFPPWNKCIEIDWKDTQMEPKSINKLKLVFQFQICTHYSSLTEMQESQQSYDDLAIEYNFYNEWHVQRLCDVVTDTHTVTSIPVESCTYEWRVHNFSKKQEGFQSNTFSIAASEPYNFFLRMNNHQSQDIILLYLCLDKSVKKETDVCLKISILDKDGHKFCAKDNLIKLFEGELQYECSDKPFDKKDFISNGLILSDDTLRIFVELNFVGEPTCNPVIQVPIRIFPEIKSLFFNRKPTDLWVKFGDKILCFHQAVFSARSKVFEGNYNRAQNKDNDINFKIFHHHGVPDAQTFEVFLRFLYTGQMCPDSMTNVLAEKLLILSDTYKVESLKSVCENVLMNQLETTKLAHNIQQSVKFLQLAYKHNAMRLKERCITIVNRHAAIIRETSAWNTLITAHPRVIADLYENLVVNRNSKSKKKKAVPYSVK